MVQLLQGSKHMLATGITTEFEKVRVFLRVMAMKLKNNEKVKVFIGCPEKVWVFLLVFPGIGLGLGFSFSSVFWRSLPLEALP